MTWISTRRGLALPSLAALLSRTVIGFPSKSAALDQPDLAGEFHWPMIDSLLLEDRGNSRWVRANDIPAVPRQLRFRSLDRFTDEGSWDEERGGWWVIGEAILSSSQAGARSGLDGDASAAVQAALDAAAALGRELDDTATIYRLDKSVTIPPRVTWRNATLVAGKAGGGLVLVSSGCRLLEFRIRGTGQISPLRGRDIDGYGVERAIYPAHDGIENVTIRGQIENVAVGVHLQPLSEGGPWPRNCTIDIDVSDIVGREGSSEGYGVLLSPARNCKVAVRAKRIARHAAYLSAGASDNHVTADVTRCHQDAVTIFSMAHQPPCERNRLFVTAREVAPGDAGAKAGRASILSVYGKANGNIVDVTAVGGATTDHGPYSAVQVVGLESPAGPFPTGNVINLSASGLYSGPYVLEAVDSAETIIRTINARASGRVGVVGFRDTELNKMHFKAAGRVENGAIDAMGIADYGIVIAAQRSPVIIGAVTIAGVKIRVRSYTALMRSKA